jgi:hypothetical protein
MPIRRRDVVVHGRKRPVGPPHAATRLRESVEGLRGRDLVHEVEVDVQEVAPVAERRDDVGVPDLVE